jgi:hypothetical protein
MGDSLTSWNRRQHDGSCQCACRRNQLPFHGGEESSQVWCFRASTISQDHSPITALYLQPPNTPHSEGRSSLILQPMGPPVERKEELIVVHCRKFEDAHKYCSRKAIVGRETCAWVESVWVVQAGRPAVRSSIRPVHRGNGTELTGTRSRTKVLTRLTLDACNMLSM